MEIFLPKLLTPNIFIKGLINGMMQWWNTSGFIYL